MRCNIYIVYETSYQSVREKSLFFSVDNCIIFIEDTTYTRCTIACHILLNFEDWLNVSMRWLPCLLCLQSFRRLKNSKPRTGGPLKNRRGARSTTMRHHSSSTQKLCRFSRRNRYEPHCMISWPDEL